MVPEGKKEPEEAKNMTAKPSFLLPQTLSCRHPQVPKGFRTMSPIGRNIRASLQFRPAVQIRVMSLLLQLRPNLLLPRHFLTSTSTHAHNTKPIKTPHPPALNNQLLVPGATVYTCITQLSGFLKVSVLNSLYQVDKKN